MQTLVILGTFILGLMIGSFANSVIYRLADLKTILKERSLCPHCKNKLGFWDLIPLISFAFLLGKCRYCSQRISFTYPAVELLTGLIFVTIYLYFGLTFYAVLLAIIFVGLIVIAFYDFRKMIIPDEILLPIAILAVLSLIMSIFVKSGFGYPKTGLENLLLSFYGLVTFSLPIIFLFVVSKGKWMGFGDIKLGLFLGLVLGFPSAIVAIFLTFLIGGLAGIILVALGKKQLKDKVPFAPFMILGMMMAIFWGEQILNWYLGLGF